MNHDICSYDIALRPVTPEDFPTIEDWLHKAYIRKWYGDPQDWMAEIRNDSGTFGWLRHLMAIDGATPIGFCQYYDCAQTQPGFAWEHEPPGTFGIDYLIGEEAYLHKGLGNVLLQALIRRIGTRENAVRLIADPVPENMQSIRLLTRNGFALDPATGLYGLPLNRV